MSRFTLTHPAFPLCGVIMQDNCKLTSQVAEYNLSSFLHVLLSETADVQDVALFCPNAAKNDVLPLASIMLGLSGEKFQQVTQGAQI